MAGGGRRSEGRDDAVAEVEHVGGWDGGGVVGVGVGVVGVVVGALGEAALDPGARLGVGLARRVPDRLLEPPVLALLPVRISRAALPSAAYALPAAAAAQSLISGAATPISIDEDMLWLGVEAYGR